MPVRSEVESKKSETGFGSPGLERNSGRPSQPCGRSPSRAIGRTLMRLRRLSESREKEVAHYWFCAPGVPFTGFPVFPPSPRPRLEVYFRRQPHAPLGDLRASPGHLPKIHRCHGPCRRAAKPEETIRRAAHPPELPSPTALQESGIRWTRAYHARHGPASAFRALSPVYSPRNPSGLISSR
jgi:hypothetical protein